MEQWKQIVDFPKYEVSDQGNIRNIKTQRVLKPSINWKGYLLVNLYEGGKMYSKRVHRLVAQNFVPNPKGKKTVDHINMNKFDNRAVNLRWQTNKEQMNNKDQDYKTNILSEKAKEANRKYYQKHKQQRREYYLKHKKKN